MAQQIVSVSVKGLGGIQKMFTQLRTEDIPKAAMSVKNNTAFKVRTHLVSKVQTVFDRPMPVTKSAILYQKTTLSGDPPAGIITADDATAKNQGRPPVGWFWHHVHGGRRYQKGHEKFLAAKFPQYFNATMQTAPGKDAKIDGYGNQSSAQIRAIMDGLKKGGSSGYFVNQHGVFKREPGKVLFFSYLMAFIRARNYKPIFDFYGEGMREASRVFPLEADAVIQKMLDRYRGGLR